MTDDPEIRRMMTHLSPAWHGEFREKVARHLVETNRAYGTALDAQPDDLTRDVNRFFEKDQTMPMTTPSGAMPASLSPDNFTAATGGRQFARRNHGGDQGMGVEELLRLIQQTIINWGDQEVDAFVGGLSNLLGGNGEEPGAEDQSSPMQFSNGSGTAPADLLAPGQGSPTGTSSEADPTGSGPRGTADSRYGYGPRRQAHDARMAQDSIDRRYQNQKSFDQRFGTLVAHIDVWR